MLTWLVVNFRNARGLARVTYSGTPVGSVVDICHKNEMQCSSFQKFTSFFEHILLQNCLVALPYQPSSQQKCQEVSGLNFSLGLSIIMKTFKELLLPLRQLSSWKVVDKFGLCFMRQLQSWLVLFFEKSTIVMSEITIMLILVYKIRIKQRFMILTSQQLRILIKSGF